MTQQQLRDEVLRIVEASGAAGLRTDAIMSAACKDGVSHTDISDALHQLKQRGKLTSARVSWRVCRYFANQADADAYMKRQKTSPGPEARENLGRFKSVAPSKRGVASWPKDAMDIITERTKITVAPPPPEHNKTNTYDEW